MIENLFRKGLSAIAILMLMPVLAQAQQGKRTVTGVVIDSQGEPLYGAVIVEDGTSNAVTATEDGSYKITVKDSQETVLFVSFIGMKAQRVPIGNSSLRQILCLSLPRWWLPVTVMWRRMPIQALRLS